MAHAKPAPGSRLTAVTPWAGTRSNHPGVPDVTSHSFRKTVATLIDDEGLSARIGADHLGHARVSETQDTYMARGRSRKVVAELLDKAITDGFERAAAKNGL